MKPYNIYVTLAFPPDTDTPGLAEENKMKVTQQLGLAFLNVTLQSLFLFCFRPQPLETKLISETSGVCQPDHVAKIIVRDAVVRN